VRNLPFFNLYEKKWRRLRSFVYLTKVITGVKFKDSVEVTEVDLVAA